jgi:hypothetical protein
MQKENHYCLLLARVGQLDSDVLVVLVDLLAVPVGDRGKVESVVRLENGQGFIGVGELGRFEMVDLNDGLGGSQKVEHLGCRLEFHISEV